MQLKFKNDKIIQNANSKSISQVVASLQQTEFAILIDTPEQFIQTYMTSSHFIIEYRAGSANSHYYAKCSNKDDVIRAFVSYLDGNDDYKKDFLWSKLEFDKQIDPPNFIYNPNAYKLDIIKSQLGICSVCNKQRELKYDGAFYSRETPDYICPWCISNGTASKKYGGEFSTHNTKSNVSLDLLNIATQQTPSYIPHQEAVWLSHCDKPCVFLSYVGYKDIEPFIDEVIDDIENLGISLDIVKEYMSAEGDTTGYLFQCTECNKHRLHIDLS